MPETQIIKSSKLSWLNIINASDKEIDYLKKKFKFNQLDLDDCYAHKHAQRPKIYLRPHYIFIVLLFPIYNRQTREITPAEIDIFVTKNHLITLHYNQLKPLKDFFKKLQKDKNEKNIYFNDTSIMLLYEILDRLYNATFPMIDHFSLNINAIEKNIFKGKAKESVKEILIVKRNIVNFRRIMQVHKNIYKKLLLLKTNFLATREIQIFYNYLIDYTKNIWDITENMQQTIDALEDTNDSIVSFRLNTIMKTLTMFSVIVFPLTLFAAIFAMRADYMPIIGSYLDFWKIIFIMFIIATGMLSFFKYKKWF